MYPEAAPAGLAGGLDSEARGGVPAGAGGAVCQRVTGQMGRGTEGMGQRGRGKLEVPVCCV